MNKQDKTEIRNKLVDFAVRLGYTVELDAKTAPDDAEEGTKGPAGDCNYNKRRIRVREGKGIEGQVCTLIHELSHALGLGGDSWYSMLGEGYVELACESITEFVAGACGIDRTHKTAPRIMNYGFGGFLATPVTTAITNVFCDELGLDRFELPQITFKVKKVTVDA